MYGSIVFSNPAPLLEIFSVSCASFIVDSQYVIFIVVVVVIYHYFLLNF